jgi:hypothetical protein
MSWGLLRNPRNLFGQRFGSGDDPQCSFRGIARLPTLTFRKCRHAVKCKVDEKRRSDASAAL